MSDLRELYQDVILDHHKKPRNFRKLEGGRHVEGYNPLCGDRVTVYLKMEGDVIKDISFEGSGCAISTASASIMTQALTYALWLAFFLPLTPSLYSKAYGPAIPGPPTGATSPPSSSDSSYAQPSPPRSSAGSSAVQLS